MAVPYPNIPLYTLGARVSFVPRVIRDDGDLGPPAQRLSGKAAVWEVRIQWVFSSEEYAVFDLWFRNDLAHGAREFVMDFDWGNGLVPTIFRFTPEGFSTSNRGWQDNVVDASIYTYQQPPLADPQEYRFTWVEPQSSQLSATPGQLFSVQNIFDGDREAPISLEIISGVVTFFESPAGELFQAPNGDLFVAPAIPGDPPPWLNIVGDTFTGVPTESLYRFITPPKLPDGFKAQSYSINIATMMGVGASAFTLMGGELPQGLTLSPNGLLSGTFPAPPMSITTNSVGVALYGVEFARSLAAVGGKAPRSFSITQGALPVGVSISPSTGVISGIAQDPTTLIFTAEAHLGAIAGTSSVRIATFGGFGAKSFSVVAGTLPPGFSLDSATGTLSN